MYDERFARQYRYEPPPEFPLASPSSGIVHHLSGPDTRAPLKPFTEDQGRLAGHALHFHCARGVAARVLAHVSDSLVRVSRRVGWKPFASRSPGSGEIVPPPEPGLTGAPRE